MGRASDWTPLHADEGAGYDFHDTMEVTTLEPMIATPSSPSNVVRVRDVPKVDVFQS